MNTAALALLIIVSGVLSIFLILSIVVVVQIIRLLKRLRQILNKAEKLAESAEAVGTILKKSAGPMAVGRFLLHTVEAVHHHDEKPNKRKEDDE